MKRILPAACALLFLISCTRTGSLQPSQVLEKASQANQILESANFTVNADVQGNIGFLPGDWNGNAMLAGQMSNKGKQIKFNATVSADTTDENNDKTHYELGSDLVIAGEEEVYMRINTLEITPDSILFPPDTITTLLNQWWLIPSGTGATPGAMSDITPDPTLLKMQTDTISVTKDNGLVDMDGHTAYLYDITIDPVKMRNYLTEMYKAQGRTPTNDELALSETTAKGRIWIDSTDFFIRRIIWNISSNDRSKPLEARIDVSISQQNEPVTITIPADFHPFPSTSR